MAKGIEIIKQETDRSCGIACLRSVANYYGIKLSEKDIFDKHEFYNSERNVLSPMITLGLTSLKLGLKAKYVGYNPVVANQTNDNLKMSLEAKSSRYKDMWKFYVDKTLEFMKLGGEVVIDRLNIPKLEKLINENGFIIAGIRPAFMSENNHITNIHHKVILDGYDKTKNSFHVLDPVGKKYDANADNFLMAFYQTLPEVLIINK